MRVRVATEEQPRLADIEKLIKFKIDQIAVTGFAPGAASHHEEREERRPCGPRSPVAMPRPAAHIPAITTDGFDFSKPYEGKAGAGATIKSAAPPRRPVKPVAALLGGFGKKTSRLMHRVMGQVGYYLPSS